MAAQMLSNAVHLSTTRNVLRSTPPAGVKSATPPSRAKFPAAPLQRQNGGQSRVTTSVVMAPEVRTQRSRAVHLPASQYQGEESTACCSVRVQAETATTAAIPDLDFDALAGELDKKSPLEIMDHVRPQQCCTLLVPYVI